MIFGKHINKYYLKYRGWILVGLLTLVVVDYLQLLIPNLYQMIINGMNDGYVMIDGVQMTFDVNFLLDKICMPMVWIILAMVFGRFLWRVTFFGAGIRVETELRNEMFDHAKDLSREYYQVNKVGNLMSLFTNDLDTVQECVGWGFLMFFDAAFLGVLAIIKMCKMDLFLTLLSMVPMVFLMAMSMILGKYMTKKWDVRQAAFPNCPTFPRKAFPELQSLRPL